MGSLRPAFGCVDTLVADIRFDEMVRRVRYWLSADEADGQGIVGEKATAKAPAAAVHSLQGFEETPRRQGRCIDAGQASSANSSVNDLGHACSLGRRARPCSPTAGRTPRRRLAGDTSFSAVVRGIQPGNLVKSSSMRTSPNERLWKVQQRISYLSQVSGSGGTGGGGLLGACTLTSWRWRSWRWGSSGWWIARPASRCASGRLLLHDMMTARFLRPGHRMTTPRRSAAAARNVLECLLLGLKPTSASGALKTLGASAFCLAVASVSLPRMERSLSCASFWI